MAYKIFVFTEDNNEYELSMTFKTEKAAIKKLEEILQYNEFPGTIDNSEIVCGVVEKF